MKLSACSKLQIIIDFNTSKLRKYVEQGTKDTGLIKFGISCQKIDPFVTHQNIQTS